VREKFGVGVIGATGYIGAPYRAEIRHSASDARIVALCARRPEPLELARQEDGAALATDDWRRVVEHPDVDLVIVATPDALHHEAVMACAAAGKHMLCEKPVGATSAEALEMWQAYESSGLGHFVPFWTRYFPIFARARELYLSGLVGEVKAVVYRWHNPRPMGMPLTWRDDPTLSSAGSIADVGSHAYDIVRWTLAQEAVRVLTHADTITAAKPDVGEVNLEEALEWGQSHPDDTAGARRKGATFDYADIAFALEGGAVGSLVLSHATYLRKGLAPELELHGTEASLGVDRVRGELTIARPDGDAEVLERVPEDITANRFADHAFPALRAQIAGEETDHPDLRDGWRVQCFTDACAQSAREGAWVEIETEIG